MTADQQPDAAFTEPQQPTHEGAPLYPDHKSAPDHLLSRSKLKGQGLRPADPKRPDAYVRWSDGSRPPYGVFDVRGAVQIPRPPTPDERRAHRDEAAAWAREFIANPRAVVVDIETTSLDGPVIEIAAVQANGFIVFESLVNPGVPISPEATAKHGITDADVADAPTLADIDQQLRAALDGRPIAAWNKQFDQSALRRSYSAAALDVPAVVESRWYCAMKAHARYVGEWDENHGEYRNHRADGEHRCAPDCVAAWGKIRSMAGNMPCPETLAYVQKQLLDAINTGAYDQLDGPDAARTIHAVIGQIREGVTAA